MVLAAKFSRAISQQDNFACALYILVIATVVPAI